MSHVASKLLILSLTLTGLLLTGCKVVRVHSIDVRTPSKVYNIAAYGAVNDPTVDSSDAFRKAIAACHAAGGGIVVVPEGNYLTGPLDLVNNLNLHLERHATVIFSTERSDYPDITSRWEGLTEKGPHPLIFADCVTNVAITGEGTFDGQGNAWWARMDMAEHGNARPNRPIRRRPMFLQVRNCRGVLVSGPTFLNAPFWNVHLLYSEYIEVAHCRMIAPSNSPNTDGLNTDSCRHVYVHDCLADDGDDGFGIKSGRDEEGRKAGLPTEDVTYQRCVVLHGHSVCAIGSEQSGGVRHVHFLDCTGIGTDNGIRLKSMRGRGGVVEDITASNFKLTNVTNAIVITSSYVKTEPEPFSERTPVFRNIHIDHVTATGSKNCCVINGLEEQPIENVTLRNLSLAGTNGVSCDYAKDITFEHVRVSAQKNPFTESHSENIQMKDWTGIHLFPGQTPEK